MIVVAENQYCIEFKPTSQNLGKLQPNFTATMWLQVLEILKYTLPAVIVMITAYLVLKSFLENETRKLDIKLRKETTKETLLLRLQGYERLMIFLERISPPNLLVRFDKEGLTAREFQQILIAAIREEYEHNLSQQIYVSADSWRLVVLAKDETIKVINLISQANPIDASALELSREIISFYINTERTFPGDEAMLFIKDDVRKLL